jgi:hypothetical protein
LWGPVAETAFAALNPKAAPPGPSAAPPGPSTVPPGSSAAPPGPSAAPPRPSPAPPGQPRDSAGTRYVQIGALAGAQAAVPSSLLASRKLTISGSGAGSVSAADIKGQIPVYIKLIAEGSVQVPFRTFLLSDVGAAWTDSALAGPRVVIVPK